MANLKLRMGIYWAVSCGPQRKLPLFGDILEDVIYL
jgi:hypothetical protein